MLQRTDVRSFVAAVFLMGLVRFVLTIAGLSDAFVKYFSISAVLIVGTVYFAFRTDTHKERLKAAYLLMFPYMVVEVAALGYTWFSGRKTIFHSADYSFGTTIGTHTLGHLVGGLTWEPLGAFLIMEILWLISRPFRHE